MIYRLKDDQLHYMVFHISGDELEYGLGDVFILHDTTKQWADFWRPLHAEFFDGSDKKNVIKIPDITCWNFGDLALSQKAYDALYEELSEYGEFLPVTVEGIPYWVLHVTKFTDISCVDETKSERFIDEAQCINLVRLAFKEEAVKDLLIFRTEYSGYQLVYCTEKFKKRIEALGLAGLLFKTDLESIF